MSRLDAKPRCACCATQRDFIARHLDPDGTIDHSEDPAEVVEGFNAMLEDGDCGVTTTEMREYLAELPPLRGKSTTRASDRTLILEDWRQPGGRTRRTCPAWPDGGSIHPWPPLTSRKG